MNYIYADDLKKIFTVRAHFYSVNGINLRNRLEINRIESKTITPDATVVMMNPGSSHPLHDALASIEMGLDDLGSLDWITNQELVPTQPDNAQYQIMRLMELHHWNFVRVLNLSDIRAGNAVDLKRIYEQIKLNFPELAHSIFTQKRKDELSFLIGESTSSPILPCWGSSILDYISSNALAALPAERLITLTDTNGAPLYRYPSPYMKTLKLDWLQKMHNVVSVYYKTRV